MREAEKMFLVQEINEEWRRGWDYELSDAWDPGGADVPRRGLFVSSLSIGGAENPASSS